MNDQLLGPHEVAWELARTLPVSEAIDALAARFAFPRQEAARLVWSELREAAPRPDDANRKPERSPARRWRDRSRPARP